MKIHAVFVILLLQSYIPNLIPLFHWQLLAFAARSVKLIIFSLITLDCFRSTITSATY